MRKIALLLCILTATSAIGQTTTGKISGKVIDRETGEPLPYVNVIVEQTTMGAATSLDGTYFIINVPVRAYSVKASMMGYNVVTVENVQVSAGLTSVVDFQLPPTVLELEEIVVTAKRPIVQKDVTSSVRLVTGRAIDQMPLRDFEDVVALQVGAIETGRTYTSGIHIRGGRANEVAYIVDGIYVNDPVVGLSGITVAKNAIQELQILSGGFNAEYGQAMSGVVNIVTREGGSDYGGSVRFSTDRATKDMGSGFSNVDLSLGGPVPIWKNATFFFSGDYVDDEGTVPMWDEETFTARFYKNGVKRDSTFTIDALRHNDTKDMSGTGKLVWKLKPTIKLGLTGNWAKKEYHRYSHRYSFGDWLRDLYRYKTGNSQINLTLTHQLWTNTFYTFNIGRFNTYTQIAAQDGRHYNDFRAISDQLAWVAYARDARRNWYNEAFREWDLPQEIRARYERHGITDPEEIAWMYYYEFQKPNGHLDTETGDWVWDGASQTQKLKNAWEALNDRYHEVNTWQFVIDEDGDTLNIYYHEFDLDQYLRDVQRFKVDTTMAESDFEPSGNMYRIRYADMWYPGDRYFYYYFRPAWIDRNTTHYTADISLTSQINKSNQMKAGAFVRKHFLDLTDVQFVNENPYADSYRKEPLVAAAYLQDKIEYEEMTVNAGLRFDYFDPRSEFFVDYENLDEGQEWVEPKWQFSPRLGISFAVSDKAVMYASYGHFFQPIDLGDLYQSLEADISSGLPLIGNPNLPPQKEVMYETGFRYAFNPDLAFEVTAYYKDVKTLLSTEQVNTIWQGGLASYTIHELENFAVIKGVDFVLQKRAFQFLSGSFSYSFLDAKGTGSFGREFYYRYLRRPVPVPDREYALEFDITHAVKTDVNFYCPEDFGPSVMNFKPLSDLNVSLQFTLASGAPYTPTDLRDNPVGDPGSKRMYATHWVDTKIDKRFRLSGLGIHLFMEITNLFNKKNVADIWTHTGKPDDDGRRPEWDPPAYSSYEDYGYESAEEWYEDQLEKWALYVNDPTNYSDPRKIRFGIAAEF